MRHRKSNSHLSRPSNERRALFRNMVTSLLRYETINTTTAKAKAVRPIAEKVITLGKKGDLSSRRRAAAYLTDKSVLKKLFDELGERFKEREGGYTRITKLSPRAGDAAEIAVIELVD